MTRGSGSGPGDSGIGGGSRNHLVMLPELANSAAGVYCPGRLPGVDQRDGANVGSAVIPMRNIVEYTSIKSPGARTSTLKASAQVSMVAHRDRGVSG